MSAYNVAMLLLKILLGGIPLEIGSMMKVKEVVDLEFWHRRVHRIIGFFDDFHNECLSVGNLWQNFWNNGPIRQLLSWKPLLDPNREWEKSREKKKVPNKKHSWAWELVFTIFPVFPLALILTHYSILNSTDLCLETLWPYQLLEQMVCIAFRASANTQSQTNFGGLKQMTMKKELIYITMASVLKPLQGATLFFSSISCLPVFGLV